MRVFLVYGWAGLKLKLRISNLGRSKDLLLIQEVGRRLK
jgi:hypothetical protein